jgi:hypothetical protein
LKKIAKSRALATGAMPQRCHGTIPPSSARV